VVAVEAAGEERAPQPPEAQSRRRSIATAQAESQLEQPQIQVAPCSTVMQRARKLEQSLPKAQDSSARGLTVLRVGLRALALMTCSYILCQRAARQVAREKRRV